MKVEKEIPLLEEVLNRWKVDIGDDFTGYRNHVYRMAHFCFALHHCNEDERRKVLIAGAFHDLGIWTDQAVDYLPPSIALARAYLDEEGLDDWIPEIELMIDMHHKIRSYRQGPFPLVEVFRRGDLVDFSLGLFRFGLPSAIIREVKAAFPNAGFHRRLAQLAGGWFKQHPLSVPPFFRW